MSVPNDSHQYSTLELATDADLVRQGQYPEVVPASGPEAYGYYDPQKPEQDAQAAYHLQNNTQVPYPTTTTTNNTYSTYPEVVDPNAAQQPAPGANGSRGAKICGLRRRYFWLLLAAAILIIVGIVVGVVVGVTSGQSKHDKNGHGRGSGSASGSGSGSGGDNGNNSTQRVTLFENTRLASANFTDAYGNNNFLVAYQLNDTSVCMSAFNTSNNKWVASTVVNGTGGGIKVGTALAIDTFWEGTAVRNLILFLSPSFLHVRV
jgi:hypothetical protein